MPQIDKVALFSIVFWTFLIYVFGYLFLNTTVLYAFLSTLKPEQFVQPLKNSQKLDQVRKALSTKIASVMLLRRKLIPLTENWTLVYGQTWLFNLNFGTPRPCEFFKFARTAFCSIIGVIDGEILQQIGPLNLPRNPTIVPDSAFLDQLACWWIVVPAIFIAVIFLTTSSKKTLLLDYFDDEDFFDNVSEELAEETRQLILAETLTSKSEVLLWVQKHSWSKQVCELIESHFMAHPTVPQTTESALVCAEHVYIKSKNVPIDCLLQARIDILNTPRIRWNHELFGYQEPTLTLKLGLIYLFFVLVTILTVFIVASWNLLPVQSLVKSQQLMSLITLKEHLKMVATTNSGLTERSTTQLLDAIEIGSVNSFSSLNDMIRSLAKIEYSINSGISYLTKINIPISKQNLRLYLDNFYAQQDGFNTEFDKQLAHRFIDRYLDIADRSSGFSMTEFVYLSSVYNLIFACALIFGLLVCVLFFLIFHNKRFSSVVRWDTTPLIFQPIKKLLNRLYQKIKKRFYKIFYWQK